jgi:hypothetical protein
MNKRLAKIAAAFGAAAAITGITGCNSITNNAAPEPAPTPVNETYYFDDARTGLCFSTTFTDASHKYLNGISSVDCTADVKAKIPANAADLALNINDIKYDREPRTETCSSGFNSPRETAVPCTDKVMALVPAGNTGGYIQGPATVPQMEGWNTGTQDDLDASIPGTGIALGGDNGNPGLPLIHIPGVYSGLNPLPVPPNHRALPTGTAVGPHGEHFGFYAIVPFSPNPAECTYTCYTDADTVVVDLANPGKPLFMLHGISQASAAYDKKTGRMIVLGNLQNGERALWQSAPVGQNAAWHSTLEFLGTFNGPLNANRESQIVPLPKGGFLVVGAGENRGTLPLQAATATTPQGLLTAPATVLVTPQTLPQVYGPTITDIQEVDCKQVVTVRTSTFGPAADRYDPHTYSSKFTIGRTGPCI